MVIGTVKAIEEKRMKNGDSFFLVSVGDKTYSTFDAKVLDARNKEIQFEPASRVTEKNGKKYTNWNLGEWAVLPAPAAQSKAQSEAKPAPMPVPTPTGYTIHALPPIFSNTLATVLPALIAKGKDGGITYETLAPAIILIMESIYIGATPPSATRASKQDDDGIPF